MSGPVALCEPSSSGAAALGLEEAPFISELARSRRNSADVALLQQLSHAPSGRQGSPITPLKPARKLHDSGSPQPRTPDQAEAPPNGRHASPPSAPASTSSWECSSACDEPLLRENDNRFTMFPIE
jgi:hypothetical protein